MRLGLMAAAAAVSIVGLAAPPAHAGCRWTWACTRGAGQCRQVPLCDSPLDIPPPPPPEVPPIPAPSVRPVPQPQVPPVGTTYCRKEYLCNNYGQCRWQQVCS